MSGRYVRNKQVKLKNYVSTVLKETDMEVQSCDIILDLKEGSKDDVLVKNLYLSCDPYMRIRMSGQNISHSPPFKVGQVNQLPFKTIRSKLLVKIVPSIMFLKFKDVSRLRLRWSGFEGVGRVWGEQSGVIQ